MAAIRIPGEGVTYESIEALEASIRELEELRELEVGELRAEGKEGRADRKSDAYAAAIRRRQERLRQLQERQARSTPQPRNVPRRKPARSSSGGGGRSSRPSSRRPDPILRPAARDVERFAERTGLGDVAGGAADLFWTMLGAAIGVSVLYALLTGRGPRTVERLAEAAADAASAFVDPRDPFLLGSRPGEPYADPVTGRGFQGGVAGTGGGQGGRGPVRPPGPREEGASTLDTLLRWARHFGMPVTSTTGGKHVEGSYHYQRRAIDVGLGAGLDRFAAWARKHPRLFKEFFWPGDWFIKDGRVHDAASVGHDFDGDGERDHDDHGHIAI